MNIFLLFLKFHFQKLHKHNILFQILAEGSMVQEMQAELEEDEGSDNWQYGGDIPIWWAILVDMQRESHCQIESSS